MSFECYSVNAAGEQCWNAPIGGDAGFFFPCELVDGFSRQGDPDGRFEAALACEAAGELGAAASQLLDGVGGYNVFRTQLRRTARPRRARESESAEDEEGRGAAVFSEMTTSVEVDEWTFRGIGGETPGARFGWRRQTGAGHLFGVSASYQDADPDVGMSSRLLTAHLSYGHTLGPTWTWSVSGTVSDFSGLFDQTLIGATGLVGFSKYFPRGSVVSGGAVLQYQSADDLQDDLGAAGFGLAYGFPIGGRLALDLEGYAVSVVEGDLRDEDFYTLAAMLSIYLTPRFAATLGYRVLEGIDDLDSDAITFGASTRWR